MNKQFSNYKKVEVENSATVRNELNQFGKLAEKWAYILLYSIIKHAVL